MNKSAKIFALIFIPVIALSVSSGVLAQTSAAPNASQPNAAGQLQTLIDQKNAEMQQIQNQRDALQAQLNAISQSKKSLSNEVKSINYKISQLDLQQKANQITVEKLNLEINSMNQNISQAQIDIQKRKTVIAKLFQEMQSQDHQTLLATILESGGLAESVDKTNEISNLQSALLKNISDLRNMQDDLGKKIETESQKKAQRQMEQVNLASSQYILQDQKNERQDLLSQTQDQEKVYQDQIAKLDEQQSAISKYIEDIEDQLRASFNPNLLPIKRPGVLDFPVSDAVITQYYGPTKFAERAYRTGFHTGVDFSAVIGTPVFATADGTITRVDNNDRGTSRWNRYQYGRYILIAHTNNLSSLYAHLSRAMVKTGDIVKKGDLIGYSGNSGYATGPHLHFGVYWTPSIQLKPVPPAAGLVPIGVTIDPMSYLPNGDVISKAGSY
ncbi:MAG: peptidoglycan DD-metalloendopeptidase family protein [Minisyncoccia bacterium]|jgi:murein DD-endopeptidase MepM/ murein hydrolase activator NlpD